MGTDKKYYLGFSYFLGIGPVRFKQIINAFGNVKSAYLASHKDLSKIIGDRLSHRFVTFRDSFNTDKKIKEIKSKNIKVLTLNDDKYPQSLKNISDPPICLYIKGDLKKIDFNNSDSTFFAVVGTRKPTSYGVRVTKRITRDLVECDLITVSGLALGIDAVSHLETLRNGGKTIAVLGCGVDIVYPKENRKIYEDIINKRQGLIVSEFPPGHSVSKGLFVARNRIISGLSQGVLVVEGTEKSGSLITASYAATQGRDVFAIPNCITSPQSQAPHILLKQGAILTTSGNDICSALGKKYIATKNTYTLPKNLNEIEEKVCLRLMSESMTPDVLSEILELPITKVIKILTQLELKGIIKTLPTGEIVMNIT